MTKIVVGQDKQEFMVHTFLWKQSGMLLVEVTTRDGNVELTPIGVNEVEPAVFSFVIEWLYECRGREFIFKHWESEHPPILVYCKHWMFALEQKMVELQDYVMTQLVEWRMENADQLLHELHQEVIINKDLAKLMINQGLESWDPNKFKLADWILDVCVWQEDFSKASVDLDAGNYDDGYSFLLYTEGNRSASQALSQRRSLNVVLRVPADHNRALSRRRAGVMVDDNIRVIGAFHPSTSSSPTGSGRCEKMILCLIISTTSNTPSILSPLSLFRIIAKAFGNFFTSPGRRWCLPT